MLRTNPGFFILLAAILTIFIKKRRDKFWVSMAGLFIAMLTTIQLPVGERLLTYPFLDMELILLEVEPFSRNLAVIFIFFAAASLLYSLHFTSRKDYTFINLFVGFAVVIVFLGDFLTFWISWEVVTISAFFLVYDTDDCSRQHSAQYYLLMHILGGLTLLWGIILHYTHTGSILLTVPERGLIFIIIGIAIKLGFIGVHTWIPRTYASTSVPFHISVLMSAFTSKVGVYGLYRLIDFETNIVAYFGVFNALAGVLLALTHSNIRKILSYHIVSQIGYMIVGIGLQSQIGVTGGFFHIMNHILYKGLLFMMAGSVFFASGIENLKELGSLWKKLPVTFIAGMIASLSIAGFPFFNGYLSKTMIKYGTDSQIIYYGLFLAGIGTALSFIKIMYFGFIKSDTDTTIIRKPLPSMKISMIAMSALMMGIAFIPQQMEALFGVASSINYFSLYQVYNGALPVLLGILVFPLLQRSVLEPHPEKPEEPDFYCDICNTFLSIDTKISDLHSGDLTRYLSWALFALLFLLLNFFLFNGI